MNSRLGKRNVHLRGPFVPGEIVSAARRPTQLNLARAGANEFAAGKSQSPPARTRRLGGVRRPRHRPVRNRVLPIVHVTEPRTSRPKRGPSVARRVRRQGRVSRGAPLRKSKLACAPDAVEAPRSLRGFPLSLRRLQPLPRGGPRPPPGRMNSWLGKRDVRLRGRVQWNRKVQPVSAMSAVEASRSLRGFPLLLRRLQPLPRAGPATLASASRIFSVC
jgi:hypothetical protein